VSEQDRRSAEFWEWVFVAAFLVIVLAILAGAFPD
jgi:hypothetical protein